VGLALIGGLVIAPGLALTPAAGAKAADGDCIINVSFVYSSGDQPTVGVPIIASTTVTLGPGVDGCTVSNIIWLADGVDVGRGVAFSPGLDLEGATLSVSIRTWGPYYTADRGGACGLPYFNTTTAEASAGKVAGRPMPWLGIGPFEVYSHIALSPDMNGDGKGEILTDDRGVIKAYSPFSAEQTEAATRFSEQWDWAGIFGPGDWDGNGTADLVTVDKQGRMWLFANGGYSGTIYAQQIGHGWTPFRVVPAGDLTQDGANDMLAIDKEGRLWLYAGNGNGGWKGQPRQVGQGWVGLELYAAGDLNGDGMNDILAILPDSTLWAYNGRGNGTFEPAKRVGRGWGQFTLAAGADLNGDGRADIVGQNNATGELWFYQGNGGGSFQAPVKIGTYPDLGS
jgi:hypothetical protein